MDFLRFQEFPKLLMNQIQMGLIQEAPSDTGLVGHQHQSESDFKHEAKASTSSWKELNLAWFRKIMTLSDDCPVAIQYHELPPLHLGKPVGRLIVCSASTSGIAISTTRNSLLKQYQPRGSCRAQL